MHYWCARNLWGQVRRKTLILSTEVITITISCSSAAIVANLAEIFIKYRLPDSGRSNTSEATFADGTRREHGLEKNSRRKSLVSGLLNYGEIGDCVRHGSQLDVDDQDKEKSRTRHARVHVPTHRETPEEEAVRQTSKTCELFFRSGTVLRPRLQATRRKYCC